MNTERRWSARKPLRITVTLSHAPDGQVRALSRDASLGGMFIETAATALPLHAPVAVAFQLEEGGCTRTYELRAVVVRTTAAGVGLMFRDYNFDALHALGRVLYRPEAVPHPWPTNEIDRPHVPTRLR